MYLNASQKCIAKSISEVSSSNGKNKPTALLVLNSSKEKQAFFLPRNTYLKDHIRQLKMFTFFFHFLAVLSSFCMQAVRIAQAGYGAACTTRLLWSAAGREQKSLKMLPSPMEMVHEKGQERRPCSTLCDSQNQLNTHQQQQPVWLKKIFLFEHKHKCHACFELQYTIQQVPGELKWYLM